ncbi:MAG: four helix bundle protein [Ignavibacteriae bacterium]|nr:four helix bundle protein [Ignavibacteriota bacterium]
MMDIGLGQRIFDFIVKVIKYCRQLDKKTENKIIQNQLIKSSSSSGANYEEAQSASSKADFKYKIDISLREMRESNYWLRLINSLNKQNDELSFLMKESDELKNILGSISSKINMKLK